MNSNRRSLIPSRATLISAFPSAKTKFCSLSQDGIIEHTLSKWIVNEKQWIIKSGGKHHQGWPRRVQRLNSSCICNPRLRIRLFFIQNQKRSYVLSNDLHVDNVIITSKHVLIHYHIKKFSGITTDAILAETYILILYRCMSAWKQCRNKIIFRKVLHNKKWTLTFY